MYDEKEIKVLKVIKKGEVVGFGILKVQKKKGISFLMLMDIITINEDSIYDIINVCRRYCAKNMFIGLLLFKSVFVKYPRTILKLNFKERFNFLVKGKTEIETRALSKLNYNFYLADMDSF